MKQRSLELDVIRAIAVLLVLFVHLPSFGTPAPDWMNKLSHGGFSGVDLFFVLSGFLIGGLLFSEYREHGRLDIRRFLIRRGLKIYPAFWAVLILAVLLPITADKPTWDNLWPELFYLQAYHRGLLVVSWSLGVEENFYLLLALLVWLLTRRGGGDPFRSIPRIVLSLSIFCLLARLLTTVFNRPTDTFYIWDFSTPTHLRIDSLAFGVMLAYLRNFHTERFSAFASRFRWPLLLLGVVLMLPAFILGLSYPRMVTYGFTLLYLGAGMIVTASTAISLPRSFRWLGKIGQYSYSIYLWHGSVQFLISKYGQNLDPRLGLFLYFFLSLFVGIVVSELIEIPVLRIRDRLFPSKTAAKVVAEPLPAVLSPQAPGANS